MFARSNLLALCALAALVVAAPAPNLVVREQRSAPPSGFTHTGAAPKDQVLNLRIGLTSSNIQGLQDETMAVSTPGNVKYGQHLTNDQVNTFIAPTQETKDAVNAWLQSNGLTSSVASPAGEWISVSVPVSKANDLLGADYSTFKDADTGATFVRTLKFSVPSDLVNHIDTIHPATSFGRAFGKPTLKAPSPTPLTNLTGNAIPASCASTITPACLQAIYGIPATKATQTANKLGVSGFIDQFPQKADLTSFLSKFRTDLPSSTTFTLATLDGGSDPQGASQAGIEANLDVQYTIGVATGVPTTFFSVGENNQDGDLGGFLDLINNLNGQSAPPQVLTTSYGFNEGDLSSSLETKLCNAYMSLGAKGVSILFSSGDGGVSGSQSQSCTTFIPTFPSGCPFVTSVGATQGINPETAASFSSGGFSNTFTQPSFQSSAVASYLSALGSTNSGKFTKTGRAFPDISAQGVNFQIVNGGQTGGVDGTSCSSPAFASVISLVNDRLRAAGKSPLGFLNPFIYANPTIWNDVTSGSNPGCNTNGFPAKAGWDPVTGLGTPNFAKLTAAAGL